MTHYKFEDGSWKAGVFSSNSNHRQPASVHDVLEAALPLLAGTSLHSDACFALSSRLSHNLSPVERGRFSGDTVQRRLHELSQWAFFNGGGHDVMLAISMAQAEIQRLGGDPAVMPMKIENYLWGEK